MHLIQCIYVYSVHNLCIIGGILQCNVPVNSIDDDGSKFSKEISFVYWRPDNGHVGSTAVFEVNVSLLVP